MNYFYKLPIDKLGELLHDGISKTWTRDGKFVLTAQCSEKQHSANQNIAGIEILTVEQFAQEIVPGNELAQQKWIQIFGCK